MEKPRVERQLERNWMRMCGGCGDCEGWDWRPCCGRKWYRELKYVGSWTRSAIISPNIKENIT